MSLSLGKLSADKHLKPVAALTKHGGAVYEDHGYATSGLRIREKIEAGAFCLTHLQYQHVYKKAEHVSSCFSYA